MGKINTKRLFRHAVSDNVFQAFVQARLKGIYMGLSPNQISNQPMGVAFPHLAERYRPG